MRYLGWRTKQTTDCFLVKGNQILLAMKKRGLGTGYWNGVGGKLLPGETVEQAAIREAEEEIGVTPLALRQVGEILFLFPTDKSSESSCAIFLCDAWEGEPAETDEMAPLWFSVDDIPYDEMWESDARWLPEILAGHKLRVTVVVGENDKVIDYSCSPFQG